MLLRFCLILTILGFSYVESFADMWKGNPAQIKNKTDEVSRTLKLENDRRIINALLNNLHKPTMELPEEVQVDVSDHKYVTYCLIGKRYYEYGDPVKSAEYFYKDWLDQKELLKTATAPLPWDCGHSDVDSLITAFSIWEENKVYAELLRHYPELYAYKMEGYKISSDVGLLTKDFEKYKREWPNEAEDYEIMMRKWAQAKTLVKTVKPKALNSTVQNHEWFYSDKQSEVLKALAYYYNHKVRFMLQKALNHKDPAIATQARQYLENLDINKVTKKI